MNSRVNRQHTLIIIFGILAPIFLVSSVSAARPAEIELFQGKEVAANEVLVKFKAATPQAIIQAEMENVDESNYLGSGRVLRFHSKSKNVTTLLNEMSKRADVEYAEPNYIVHALAIPNDPSFGQLWGLRNTAQDADISATSAWDISTGSKANVVAVIDTGLDYTHPDLSANIWSAPADFAVTIGHRKINCPAGSYGFNAITSTCDPLDDDDHGSHVSGTIGAAGNNGLGIVGVNWNASIMGSKFLDANGIGTTANAIDAIEFVIQTKAIFGEKANVRVLSNSWAGGGFSQSLLDEINSADAADMLFVAAAGNSASNNDATPNYPSNFDAPNVIAVAATDNKDSKAYFSNYGKTTVDLGAPGVSIYSTIRNGNYEYYSGTSMATPHVSGAAILILSMCDMNTANLKANILNNVDPIPSLTGITVTGGRLNVNKAIRACSTGYINGFVKYNNIGIAGAVVATNTDVSTITNPSGFYSFQLPIGTYQLKATHEPEYYPNSSIAVTVVTGTTAEVQDINFIKKPTGNITGVVSRSSG